MFTNDTPSEERVVPTTTAGPWLVVIAVQHRPPDHESVLDEILARRARMPVIVASGGEPIARGTIYITRPDLHLTVGPDRRFTYVDGRRIRFLRSSANPLLETAAP